MKVKRLTMQSFRGIGDLTLDFDGKNPIVLIGVNGVGKSSILDCIAIILSHIISDIVYPEKGIRHRLISQFTKSNYNEHSVPGEPNIKKRSFKEQDIKNSFSETQNELEVLIESYQLIFTLGSKQKGKLFYAYQKPVSPNVNLDEVIKNLRNKIFSSEANLPLALYYPVNRAVIDIDLEITDLHLVKPIDTYDKALNDKGANFNTFFQWFRALEDLENEERTDEPEYNNRQLESVRQAIYSLIPEFSKLRVRRSPPLRMTLQKNDEELIINQLSDGEKCLLAMVGDLARRLAIANPGLENPLEGEGVVLIDEVELHLHPKWQREIIPALTRTFPNCQFIVTTHSPQVVSHVKPENIYILEKTENGVIALHPESSYGRDSNRILEDLMDVPKRPEEIKERLSELFRLIDAGNLEDAKKLRQELAEIIGESEPEFVRADILMRKKEILKK